jgi:alpha-glucosidase (family GH31 glycosyl hydrolase)
MVTIIDPHIKVDPNFKLYSEAKAKGVICRSKDGIEFEGNCWPGTSVWYDYLNEQARNVWADMFEYSNYIVSI